VEAVWFLVLYGEIKPERKMESRNHSRMPEFADSSGAVLRDELMLPDACSEYGPNRFPASSVIIHQEPRTKNQEPRIPQLFSFSAFQLFSIFPICPTGPATNFLLH